MMVTAEILKPCVLCCQPGSIVEVTETQFRCLGDAARALDNDAPIPYKIVDMPTMELESAENAPDAPEIPEAETATETPEKKSGRGKRKKE